VGGAGLMLAGSGVGVVGIVVLVVAVVLLVWLFRR